MYIPTWRLFVIIFLIAAGPTLAAKTETNASDTISLEIVHQMSGLDVTLSANYDEYEGMAAGSPSPLLEQGSASPQLYEG